MKSDSKKIPNIMILSGCACAAAWCQPADKAQPASKHGEAGRRDLE